MWYPQPVDVVPFVIGSHSITHEDLSARAMWPVIPFDQRAYNAVNEINGFYNDPLYTNDGRKFLLMRSLFELVLANEYLELTDPKLLGWFLCLTAEDRTLIKKGNCAFSSTEEGGLLPFLQKHPALQVDRQYVYVKSKTRGNCIPPPTTMSSNKSRHPSFYGASQCQNCGTSCSFGSKKCRCCGFRIEISEGKVCVSENEKQLELLPNSVKEELNVLTAQNDATVGCTQSTLNTQKTRCTQSHDYGGRAAHPPSYSKGMCPHAQCLSKLWEEVENREDTKHFKDTTTQANFSLDMELDMQSQVQRNDYTQNDQNQSYVQVEEADYHNLNQEAMPEYYSFSNTSLDHSTWSDGTRSADEAYNDSVMATKGSTELSDEPSNATMATAANSTDCFSCLGNSFESGDHQEDVRKKHDSVYEQQIEEINVGPSLKSKCGASVSVDQIIDACGDFRACFTSTCATEVDQIFQLKNVATDTDLLAVSHEKDTQTVQIATSEKNTITEVCMSDLDVLTEEFIKLKETTNELKQLKSRKASPSPGVDHCRRVCGCDCAQRVRRAELRLLALQFVMCQQHCWRCYFTSPLGESALWGTEGLPEGIAETLNTLQKDYHEMRKQILAGTPLDNLKPLSVDSEKITARSNYSPASVLEAHLNSFDCPGSTIASGHRVDEESEEMRALSTEVCQDTEAALDDGNKQDKALVFLPKQPGASAEKNPGVIKDPNSSEAWFDAEEELGSPNQDGKMEELNERKERTDEDKSNHSSLLCITSLPGNIAEHEVLLWFEKYNATNVCISTFSNSMRAAIVYLKSPSDAKAAVKDLHGCSLQGHTVQVVQLRGPASADPKLISDPPHSTSKTHKEEAAASGDGLGTKGVTYTSSPGGPRCSVDRLTNVCDSPTASGTCVPQHYATMGSFDTIMARLSECHPNVGRQRIVDALLELRAKHQGFLSGLPLKSIVDMTSELLTQASTPTYI
ncbi:RNA-binding protein 44-like isoform X3 [Sinocyclocheilus anshuiensis]|uniref:RNA-binding protein 44-like isoform X3 n=1 Tax=Sinocyclocheilus anshuiensis TaxID=1608454 RepID=UPI0007B8B5A5|nr:PREDICTED: RNA-binding protein 44-like isoform X3 [Sinocyclocheilus anshuiensis]